MEKQHIEREINIGTIKVPGSDPLVILGPNGSGKTRLGASITQTNQATNRISARRLVVPPDTFQIQNEQQTRQQYQQQMNATKTDIKGHTSEIHALLNKLVSEDSGSAIAFRDASYSTNEKIKPEITRLKKIRDVWASLFPDREIFIANTALKTKSTLSSGQVQEYFSSNMSDGELVALFMISRVIDAEAGIFVVDEPELHMHFALSRTPWDTLEQLRKDIRFVYITHDLNFARSRRNASYLIVRPQKPYELIGEDGNLPPDIFHLLLGAASGNVKTNDIVFCEGEPGGLDERLIKAWVNNSGLSVVPVGGCEVVVKCFEAVKSGYFIKDLNPLAMIDRDYRPEEEIKHWISKGILVLEFSEIESLLCSKGVFKSVGAYLKIDDSLLDQKYEDFFVKAKAAVKTSWSHTLLMRCKKRNEWKLHTVLSSVKGHSDIAILKSDFVSQCGELGKKLEPETVFEEEVKVMNAALEDKADFLKIFPGKIYLSLCAETLGLKSGLYFDLVCEILRSEHLNPEMKPFRDSLVNALKGKLVGN